MSQKQKNVLWIILGLVVGLGVVSFYLFYLNQNTVVPVSWGNEAGTRGDFLSFFNTFQQAILTPLVAAVLGILILRRHSRHKIGWLLTAIALTSPIAYVVNELTVYGYFTVQPPLAGIEWAAWVTNWIWVVLFALILYTLAIFPNEQFASPRFRIVLKGLIGDFTFLFLSGSTLESSLSSAFQLANPLFSDFPQQYYDLLFSLGLMVMPLTIIILVVSVIVRFRRGQGREKQQMKWLLGGMALMAVMVILGLGLSFGAGFSLGEILVNASALGPILCIGVALLRHKLYDIDIIIRRTLIYAMVSALLAVVYFGSVVVLQGLVTAVGGERSGVVVAVSTLVIAALFNPVRKRVQSIVDHRFYRQKYDSVQTLNQFAAKARDEVDMNKLSKALVEAVQETMQPEQLTLWLKSEFQQRET
jgi:hypothetical protein